MRRLLLIHLIIFSLTIVIGGYLAVVVQQIAADIYRQSGIALFSPNEATIIYDMNGVVITRLYLENRELLRYAEIPQLVKDVFISVEDHTFYRHHGFSIRGIMRAALRDLRAGRVVEGGSTITQQLAKNLINRMERTWKRYLKTFLLALEIERRMTKDEILEKYLNQIYFGEGLYGIKAAARFYFDREVTDLTLMEAACLAAIPKNPSMYSPYADNDACLDRARIVLDRMVVLGVITSDSRDQALAQELNLGRREREAEENRAPYFVEYIKQDLLRQLGRDKLFAGGLRIYTTLDLGVQQIAQTALIASEQQGAVVVLDPRSGYIKALVGGRSFAENKYNRATQAQRQPGSSFKPFVYLAALEQNYTAAQILEDLPIIYRGDETWQPRNYSGNYQGTVTMQRALEKSLNIPTINLAAMVGMGQVVRTARRLGITSPLEPNLSLSIGTSELNLLEITSAYGVIANQGVRCEPVAIRYITDGEGRLLDEITDEDGNVIKTLNWVREREAVISPQHTFLLTNIMRGVMTNGTATRSNINRPAAGKTGTTDDGRSVWFVGFTPDLVTGVYVGNDDNSPLPYINGRPPTGSSIPAPIWKEVMDGALAHRPAAEFRVPANIVFRMICLNSGELAGPTCEKTLRMAFLGGTEPMEICNTCQRRSDIFR